jgi:hypothetical protein
MKKKDSSKSGNNIQIDYTTHYKDDLYNSHTLTLQVVSLDFQAAKDDEWRGKWNDEDIWVKFTRPGHDVIFSDNFPWQYQAAASAEVERIERQFN